MQAANGSNQQSWRWLVVTDPALRDKIAELYREAYLLRVGGHMFADLLPAGTPEGRLMSSTEWLVENMARVPRAGDPVATRRTCRASTATSRSTWRRCTARSSRRCGTLGLERAAYPRLGTCITTLHLHREEEIGRLLGIPPTYTQGCLLPVGRLRAGHTFRPARRRPIDEVVARDGWDGPAL